MMTEAQVKSWWTYHPETLETATKYRAILAGAEPVKNLILQMYDPQDAQFVTYEQINNTVRDFALVIDKNAPDSADKTAAIRCLRLVRNALNEHLTVQSKHAMVLYPFSQLREIAAAELFKARWQAMAAVACGGV